ncbi:hypothetical protein F5883DRAFT_655272 [Diaporthe sp. PMI_573]|nr:hypothetical protein F5883DRAFT_655272 [Diaporthaceae sp. PMI_573]
MDDPNTSGPDGVCQGPPLRPALAASKKEAKRRATKAIKRRGTLISKADDLHHDCGYEVLLLLRKGYRSYVYTSVDKASLAAFFVDVMERYPFPVEYTAATLKAKKRGSRKYPLKKTQYLREKNLGQKCQ